MNRFFIAVFFIISAVLFSFQSNSYPDAGPLFYTQGHFYTHSQKFNLHKNIIMDSEEVVITIHDGKKNFLGTYTPTYADVKAEMFFKNPTDKTIEMDVGFPNLEQWHASDMNVRVNGISVPVSDMNETADLYPETKKGTQRFGWEFAYLQWKIWRMSFRPGEITKLLVTYKVAVYTIAYNRSFTNEEKEKLNGRWLNSRMITDEFPSQYEYLRMIGSIDRWGETSAGVEYLEKYSRVYGVSYILHTGGQWDKTIGKAVFKLTHETKGGAGARGAVAWKLVNGGIKCPAWKDAIAHKEGGKPSLKSSLDKDYYTLEFTNIKPDYEIAFIYHPELSVDEELAIMKKIKQEKPEVKTFKMERFLNSIKGEIFMGNPFKD